MAIVNKPNTFSGNTTISSSEINSNFDTLYNEFNGSISAANLADDAVTAAKLADNAVVTANITDATITPVKWTNPYKFRARRTSALSLTASTHTKIVFDTEDFDSNSNFASGTYTAPVAGFYQFNARFSASHTVQILITLYKNGSAYQRGGHELSNGTTGVTYSDIIQLAANDTIDMYAFTEGAGVVEVSAGSQPYFSGYLVSQT